MEQEEYTKEEINWSYIEFIDNQDILDLIEKVCGVYLFSKFFASEPLSSNMTVYRTHVLYFIQLRISGFFLIPISSFPHESITCIRICSRFWIWNMFFYVKVAVYFLVRVVDLIIC